MVIRIARGFIECQRLFQAGDAVLDPPRPRIGLPQRSHGDRNVSRDVPLTALSGRALEQTNRVAQFASQALQVCEIETSDDDAERVIERFGDPDRLVSLSLPLIEDAALGERARDGGPRHDGGRHHEAVAACPLVAERPHQRPGDIFALAIIACEVKGSGQVVLRGDLQWHIAEPLGDGLDPLRQSAHLGDVTADVDVIAADIGGHPSESSRIVERSRQGFGFPEIAHDF